MLREEDFLAPGPTERRFQFCAGNPPYLRFSHLPATFQERYREQVPDFARKDLLHAFLHRAADVLSDDGRLACVTADRWLINQTAASVREEIGRRFGVERASRVSAKSAFYRAKTRRKGTPPRVHPVVVVLTPRERAERPLGTEPVYPGRPVHVPADAEPLKAGANVRLAAWLGPHGVFTVDPEDAERLPSEYLVPCVDSKDIVDGTLGSATRFAIRTERDVEPHPAVRKHLRERWHLLPDRARRDLDEPNWWLPPERWGPFPSEQEALVVPSIVNELRPIRLPAGLLPVNHNLTIVWGDDLDEIESWLTSDLARALAETRGAPLENGYFRVTTTFLKNLPIVRRGLRRAA